AERVGALHLLLRRERRGQRIDPLSDNNRTRRQLVVPEVGHRHGLLDDGRFRRRGILLRRRRFLDGDPDVVLAGRNRTRPREPRGGTGDRDEAYIFVGVLGTLHLILVFLVVFLVFLVGGFRRGGWRGVLRHDAPVKRDRSARDFRRIDRHRERHVLFI